jgi:hypothetical protein
VGAVVVGVVAAVVIGTTIFLGRKIEDGKCKASF